MLSLSPDLCINIMTDFTQFEGYLPESKIKLKSCVMDLQVQIPLNLIISFKNKSGPALLPVFNFFNAPIYFTYGKWFICYFTMRNIIARYFI